MNEIVLNIFKEGLGDAKIRSMSWIDKDFIIEFLLPDDYSENLSLRFHWATCLRVDFDYQGHFGEPLLFSAELIELEKKTWKLNFEFGTAPEGCIAFECNDITIIQTTK